LVRSAFFIFLTNIPEKKIKIIKSKEFHSITNFCVSQQKHNHKNIYL
jgi:hypothetical protein